ncbi:hypothetical protein Noda2021_03160 [Candidatus Dependentiae bacterium Noda2021]|nr:hypothetical protein Noda2021_03160 [Candidatus Dependentiae bacterium Noda2021]
MKRIIVVALAILSSANVFSYTKKIEILQHPTTKHEVHFFYDFHDDEKFPGDVKQQVKEIVTMAQKKDAHIIIENLFDYQGTNAEIKDDLAMVKYLRKSLLLRDVQDLAEKKDVSIENVEYRQERDYSVYEDRLSAQEALKPVSDVIEQIKKYNGKDLQEYYQDVINEIEPIQKKLLQTFDGKKSIKSQLANRKVNKKLLEIKKDLPVDCQDIAQADVAMYYDARLLNPLIVNSIYEHQVANSNKPCIFVIAGTFHAVEVSHVLKEYLGYKHRDQQGTDDAAFIPAQSKLELAQIDKFYEQTPAPITPKSLGTSLQDLSFSKTNNLYLVV